jgi:hypothetical protein
MIGVSSAAPGGAIEVDVEAVFGGNGDCNRLLMLYSLSSLKSSTTPRPQVLCWKVSEGEDRREMQAAGAHIEDLNEDGHARPPQVHEVRVAHQLADLPQQLPALHLIVVPDPHLHRVLRVLL